MDVLLTEFLLQIHLCWQAVWLIQINAFQGPRSYCSGILRASGSWLDRSERSSFAFYWSIDNVHNNSADRAWSVHSYIHLRWGAVGNSFTVSVFWQVQNVFEARALFTLFCFFDMLIVLTVDHDTQLACLHTRKKVNLAFVMRSSVTMKLILLLQKDRVACFT